ncbi:hypothetical protein Q5752_004865 [Cryptotrichosporon argae]
MSAIASASTSARQSVPIPAIAPRRASNARRARDPPRPPSDGVMRSSLELVFSYSRSQQRFFGGLPSAPSFVADRPSWSPRHRYSGSGSDWPEHEHEHGDERGNDVEGGWDESMVHSGSEGERDGESGGEHEMADQSRERTSRGQRRSRQRPSAGTATGSHDSGFELGPGSDSPTMFPTDPVRPDGGIEGPRAAPPARFATRPVEPASAGSGSGSASRRGLLSLFSPAHTPADLAASLASSSSMRNNTLSLSSRPEHWPRDLSPKSETPPATRPTENTPLLAATPQRRWVPDRLSPRPSVASLTPRARRASVDRRGSVAGRRSRRSSYVGESSDGQTLFNAVAVLLGIGLLSLPLAYSYAGWVGGTAMLVGFAYICCHTAKLLAALIHSDSNLMGYTDIGRKAFGRWGGFGISALFFLELFAYGVALIVLFGDTLNALFPTVSSTTFKLVGFFFMVPTTLLPLRLLSLPSLLSTIASFFLVTIVLLDGILKPVAPGSLRDPMPTNWAPELAGANWLGALGIILAGFGGHAVIPTLARDMRNPNSFPTVINKAFAIATVISLISGAAGYLMIGNSVSDEITRDLLLPKYGYPRGLNVFLLWMIVINPLSKFGLSSRPLNVTLETLLGLTPTIVVPPEPVTRLARASRASFSAVSRVGASDYIPGGTPIRFSAIPEHAVAEADDSRPGSPHKSPSPSPSPSRARALSARRGTGASRSGLGALEHAASVAASVVVPPPPSYGQLGHGLPAGPAQGASSVEREGTKGALRVASRTAVTALCIAAAVALPGFGRVMAFLGSFSAFLICVILPLCFHLKLSAGTPRSSPGQKVAHVALLAASVVLMVAGTVWAFLPGSGHGELDP